MISRDTPSRRRPTGLLAVAVAGMVSAMLIIFGGTAHAATLFSDDFQDGNSSGWSTSAAAGQW